MSSDPGRGRSRGYGGQLDRPPGWADTLLAGRSRADKEADQDARSKALLLVGSVVVFLILALHAIFSVVGLQLGWWSAPVFVPMFAWALFSVAMNRVLRPVELDGLRWPARLKGAGLLALLLWVCWGWWAAPVARAWKEAHGGFHGIAGGGPRYPLHAAWARRFVLGLGGRSPTPPMQVAAATVPRSVALCEGRGCGSGCRGVGRHLLIGRID